MSYDPEKDKEIWHDSFPGSRSTLYLRLYEYDGKSHKFQLSRTYLDSESGVEKHSKLGRLTRDELMWLSDVGPDAVDEYVDSKTKPNTDQT